MRSSCDSTRPPAPGYGPGMAFDTDRMVERVRTECGKRLLAAALALQAAYRDDVSKGNPAPHDDPAPKGEFPRLRTGGGRANVAIAPATVPEVARAESVSVGFRPGGMHLLYLSGRGWKGLVDTYGRAGARLRALVAGGGR